MILIANPCGASGLAFRQLLNPCPIIISFTSRDHYRLHNPYPFPVWSRRSHRASRARNVASKENVQENVEKKRPCLRRYMVCICVGTEGTWSNSSSVLPRCLWQGKKTRKKPMMSQGAIMRKLLFS